MTAGLKRYYGRHHLHFITTSCYHRRPYLDTPDRRDLLLEILEEARQRFHFVVVGYVVMPEHVHLLISETGLVDPSVVMKWVKYRFSRRILSVNPQGFDNGHFWQHRFYDFNVFTPAKCGEKLNYMHLNPVKRGLVARPEDWRWSSARYWLLGENGPVKLNVGWPKLRSLVKKS